MSSPEPDDQLAILTAKVAALEQQLAIILSKDKVEGSEASSSSEERPPPSSPKRAFSEEPDDSATKEKQEQEKGKL